MTISHTHVLETKYFIIFYIYIWFLCDPVRVVPKRTVIGDWRFDIMSGDHGQRQVNSVCHSTVLPIGVPLPLAGDTNKAPFLCF